MVRFWQLGLDYVLCPWNRDLPDFWFRIW